MVADCLLIDSDEITATEPTIVSLVCFPKATTTTSSNSLSGKSVTSKLVLSSTKKVCLP